MTIQIHLSFISFGYFIEYDSRERGMQWLCIPSNVSMERCEHVAMNENDHYSNFQSTLPPPQINLLEGVIQFFFYSDSYRMSESLNEKYDNDDDNFSHGYNSHFNEKQKIWWLYDVKYASRILIYWHTQFLVPNQCITYSIQKKKRIFNPIPESWRIKIKLLIF